MKLAEVAAPQKLYMLAGELLRDEGKANVSNQDTAFLLGSAIAFMHFENTPDPSMEVEMHELIRDAVDAAMMWHDALVGAVDEAPRR